MSSRPRSRPGHESGSAQSRLQAASAVAAVLAGQSLAVALPETLRKVPARQHPMVQNLCYGALRQAPRLQAILDRLLKTPLSPGEQQVRALVITGLYGLLCTRTPGYATVSETVAAAHLLPGKRWAPGLVNAVLRNFLRRRDEVLDAVERIPAARFAHPDWLLQRLRRDWPEHWQQIADANNRQAPMTLRVALDRISRDDYLRMLSRDRIEAHAHPRVASAVVLAQAREVTEVPGFGQGLVSVQDAGAQLAGWLLDPLPGMRVLDACSAPGGKTGQILERQARLQVVAADIDARRLQRVADNLTRLGRRAQLLEVDVTRCADWWDEVPFERILLDAPCTATGVIRRHPDIKLLRRPSDVAALAAQQRELLRSCWRMLAPGGLLLYATCSVLSEENSAVIDGFLADHSDAVARMPSLEWGHSRGAGRQILPGEDDMDGFFYAGLVKDPAHR